MVLHGLKNILLKHFTYVIFFVFSKSTFRMVLRNWTKPSRLQLLQLLLQSSLILRSKKSR